MKTALIIVGLPASGKSCLIQELKRQPQYIDALVFDDEFCDIINLHSDNVIIAHPDFCILKIREKVNGLLVSKGYNVSFIYFDNDPDQCLLNAKARDKEVNEYIKYLTKLYDASYNRSVWKNNV